jgi:hypothetical protein
MLLLLAGVAVSIGQVDLGGHLGERSWLRPLLDALGWVDAYIERMLMAVILVKDEVSGNWPVSGQPTAKQAGGAVRQCWSNSIGADYAP